MTRGCSEVVYAAWLCLHLVLEILTPCNQSTVKVMSFSRFWNSLQTVSTYEEGWCFPVSMSYDWIFFWILLLILYYSIRLKMVRDLEINSMHNIKNIFSRKTSLHISLIIALRMASILNTVGMREFFVRNFECFRQFFTESNQIDSGKYNCTSGLSKE